MYGIPLHYWEEQFPTNKIKFISLPAAMSRHIPTVPTLTYGDASSVLSVGCTMRNVDLTKYNYGFGEISPFAGPVTVQCGILCLATHRIEWSDVSLWFYPHDIGVVVNEMRALAIP